MRITYKISLDFAQRGRPPVLYAKQGDANTRCAEISLYSAGVAWTIPDGVICVVRFRKADSTGGLYDVLPDGATPSANYTGNVLTVNFAPQMFTCPGDVQCDAALVIGAEALATFDLILHVDPSPMEGVNTSSQGYYKVQSLEQLNAELDAIYQDIEEFKQFVQQKLDEINKPSDDIIRDAVNAYLEEHPMDGVVSEAEVKRAVDAALTEAKNSGMFDGAPGRDGANGRDGTNGVDGITPIFRIGTVETLPAGSAVEVTITGTPENPLINFKIPQGQPGKDGKDGVGGNGGSGSGGTETQTVPFTVNGNPVSCVPVAGTELTVVSTLELSQEGSGTASLENIRNFDGCTELSLTKPGGSTITAQIGGKAIGNAVCAGTYNWNTGELTVTHIGLFLKVADMNNGESYPGWKDETGMFRAIFGSNVNDSLGTLGGFDSNIGLLNQIQVNTKNSDGISGNLYIMRSQTGLYEADWKEQYHDLTVQIVKQLDEPQTISMSAEAITAIAGTNTLSCNAGTLTVSGVKTVTITEPGTPGGSMSAGSVLARKKIAILGDSISSNASSYALPTWWERIKEATGADFAVNAIGGTSMAYVASLETSKGPCFVNRYSDLPDDADAVLVMGGTNDCYDTPPGAWDSSDISTLYGALNNMIPALLTKYSGKPVVFCTMMQTRSGYSSNVFNPMAQLAAHSATTVFSNRQIIAEAIKAKCAQYGVPCLDVYNLSGITGAGGEDVYFKDSLHPSDAGQEKLATFIENGLAGLFR